MAGNVLDLISLTKRFGSTAAIEKMSIGVRDNELLVVLGARNSGKSTLLRLIAGFDTPDSGSIMLGDISLARLPPSRRPINMMFPSLGLFTHLSVRENVAYGLRAEGIRGKTLRDRVDEVLEMVQLADHARSKPSRLSDEQCVRMALARSLAKRPKVLLLDEPLAGLDRKTRAELRRTIMALQRKTAIPFVMTSDDYEEALLIADRVALIDKGSLQQLGTPSDLYERPLSRFVADFMGTMNFLDARVAAPDTIEVAGIGPLPAVCVGMDEGAKVTLTVRPERVELLTESQSTFEDMAAIEGTVDGIAYSGRDLMVEVAIGGLDTTIIAQLSGAAPLSPRLSIGTPVTCTWHPLQARVLER
jgi:ABC-type Fe3+/spermidine/putrescine transport system ATPase subunit